MDKFVIKSPRLCDNYNYSLTEQTTDTLNDGTGSYFSVNANGSANAVPSIVGTCINHMNEASASAVEPTVENRCLDIGNYITQNRITDNLKFDLLTSLYKPLSTYNFKQDITRGKGLSFTIG